MVDEENNRREYEVGLCDLQTDYTIEGFRERYALYCAEVRNDAPPTYLISWPLKGLGGLLFIIGFFTIIFGPRSVTVDTFSGPTFFQFFQLYPGPLATVGSLIYGAGAWVQSAGQEEIMKPEDF